MSDLFTRLKQRKIIQWAIAYAGGAWLLLQLLSLLAQPFAWPDLVMRAAVIVLGVGFLAVLVLAWFHGEKGAQKAGGMELLMLGALFILAAAGVALVSRDRDSVSNKSEREIPAASTQQAEQRSIAVLPFDNMSDVAGNEYFADGITEDILTNLSKVTSLRVISRTSVMRYKETTLRTPEIARELNVAHILEGSVRRSGDQVRITAQLIRASDDAHLWANSYDRKLTNIFEIQTEIAKQIVDALNVHLSAKEGRQIAARPTENLEAYDMFLRARALYSSLHGDSVNEAKKVLHKVIRMDPDFVSAQALLARTYGQSASMRTYAGWKAALDSGVTIARRAVEKAPMQADAHSALGEVLRKSGRYDEALVSIKRALEIEPNLAWSVAEMGETLGPYGMGRAAEAITWAQRGISINPGEAWMYMLLGASWRILGDFNKADQAFQTMERVEPSYAGLGLRMRLALQRGDTALARTLVTKLKWDDKPLHAGALSWFYLEAGYRAEAERYGRLYPQAWVNIRPGDARLREYKALHEQIIRGGSQDPSSHYHLAVAAATERKPQEVIDHLERYVEAGGRDELLLKRHVMFANVQSDPRMQAVLERIRRDIAAQRASLNRS